MLGEVLASVFLLVVGSALLALFVISLFDNDHDDEDL